MVSTSFALVNGFGFSAFLNGGKNSHILLSAPIAARTGGSALSPKRYIVVAAPKSLGFLLLKVVVTLSTLTGLMARKLPGDYGFNPLGLGKDLAFLKW
ncbi:chlorophyll a-b binding CP24 10A, chloroplastic [Olea europaea subsp. europaea]|uniref:Chlorophyll a-b binding CP24 10A, chloroplastic n=1 Tax=Olea europaea subsp. europaea TaxID=158383 RepID=A0A8S0T965_OLEEU|nr:chlorophyll a-b binding CP24 10A, chloroplastic [Olea europaea subsp. europaea]